MGVRCILFLLLFLTRPEEKPFPDPSPIEEEEEVAV
jgi:hypothetical protein